MNEQLKTTRCHHEGGGANRVVPEPAAEKRPAKILSLQGLRAIAFFAIFLSHSRLGDIGCFGAWGVSVFFVLSGFLMMYNYYPKPSSPAFGLRFAWKKISKLYLLHMITMLCAAVFFLKTGASISKTLIDIFLHTTLLQVWIPKELYYATLNGSSWFLCVSFFQYLCFPLILRYFKNAVSQRNVKYCIAALFGLELMISAIALLLNRHDNDIWVCTKWITYYCPPVRLLDFSLGCCMGYLFVTGTKKPRSNGLSVLLIVLGIAASMLLYQLLTVPAFKSVKCALLFLPTTMLLIWTLCDTHGIGARVLSVQPLVSLGDLSPYLFLIHYVVIIYSFHFLTGIFPFAKPLLLLPNFLISLGLSILYQKVQKRMTVRKTYCK